MPLQLGTSVVSSQVNTDWNLLFRMLAFLLELVTV